MGVGVGWFSSTALLRLIKQLRQEQEQEQEVYCSVATWSTVAPVVTIRRICSPI